MEQSDDAFLINGTGEKRSITSYSKLSPFQRQLAKWRKYLYDEVELTVTFITIVGLGGFVLFYFHLWTNPYRGWALYFGVLLWLLAIFSSIVILIPPKVGLFWEFILFGTLYIAYLQTVSADSDLASTLFNCIANAFPLVIVTSGFLFNVGIQHTIRDSHHYSEILSSRSTSASLAVFNTMQKFSLSQLVPKKLTTRKQLDNKQARTIILFNYFCFTLPFILGLHWRYLSSLIPAIRINSDAHYSATQLTIITLVSIFVGALFCFHLILIYREIKGFLRWFYYIIYVIIGIFIAIIQAIFAELVERETNYASTIGIHFHHAFSAMILIPLTRFSNPVSSIFQAILLGIYLDGTINDGVQAVWSIVSK